MDLTTVREHWDRTLAVGCAAVGLVVLLAGYLGVSGQGVVAKQIPYVVSGGIGGIFLLGVAAVVWLSADLRDEWRVLEEIRLALVDGAAAHLGETAPVDEPAPHLVEVEQLRPVRARAPRSSTPRSSTPPSSTLPSSTLRSSARP